MKSFLTVAASLVCVGLLSAQNTQIQGDAQVGGTQGGAQVGGRVGAGGGVQGTQGGAGMQYRRGSGFVGSSVRLNNQNWGKITDYAIGPNGRIDYVIISQGDQFYPVPYGALQYSEQQNGYAISNPQITQERLRDTAFTRENWPNFTNQQWSQQMRTTWGENAFGSQGQGTGTGTGIQQPGGTPLPGGTPGTTTPGGIQPRPSDR
jgi:hypothetical protein